MTSCKLKDFLTTPDGETFLVLTSESIGDEEAIALADALKVNTTLTILIGLLI